MGTKMAVAFANIFMAEIETRLTNQSKTKPIKWKRYIDDIFSLWDSNRQEIGLFIKQANNFHPTIKFTAEISEMEITFLDTIITKGERLGNESILDIRTHYRPTETFQYTNFTSSHPPGVKKKGFIKGDALKLLRTLLKQSLMKVSQILNIASPRAAILTKSYKQRYQKSASPEDSPHPGNKKQKHANKSCHLSQHTTHRCAILKIYSCKTGT